MSEHPCDGPWLVLDDLGLQVPEAAVRDSLEAAGDWGLTGVMGSTECLQVWIEEIPESLGIMELRRAFEGGVPGPQWESMDGVDLVAIAPGGDLERASVLDLRGQGQGDRTRPASENLSATLRHATIGPPTGLSAVLLDELDEDTLDLVAGLDEIAALVPSDGFASGYRLGAGAHYGALPALHPGAAARASEMVEADVGGALAVERRLQRFLEAQVAPVMRRLGLGLAERDGLLLEVFEWAPCLERSRRLPVQEALRLAEILRTEVHELFGDAP